MLTAHSELLGYETDAVHILMAYGYDTKSDPLLKDIPESLRQRVNNEISCPGCDVKGLSLVAGTIDNNRFAKQPHFRSKGTIAHSEYCSYLAQEKVEEFFGQEWFLGEARDDSTELIARLISHAIQKNVLSESDFRDYRKWEFDQQLNAEWKPLYVSFDQVLLFNDGAKGTKISKSLVAHIPKQSKAKRERYVGCYTCPDVVEKIRPLAIPPYDYYFSTTGALRRVFNKSRLFGIPDLTHLSSPYLATIELAKRFPRVLPRGHRLSSLSKYWASTFQAVLLYRNGWDVKVCTSMLDQLKTPNLPAFNTTINTIGTNLFDDMSARLTVCHANMNAKLLDDAEGYGDRRKGQLQEWQALRDRWNLR